MQYYYVYEKYCIFRLMFLMGCCFFVRFVNILVDIKQFLIFVLYKSVNCQRLLVFLFDLIIVKFIQLFDNLVFSILFFLLLRFCCGCNFGDICCVNFLVLIFVIIGIGEQSFFLVCMFFFILFFKVICCKDVCWVIFFVNFLFFLMLVIIGF